MIGRKKLTKTSKRVFQTYSPLIDSIDVKRRGDVRRAKLYYMRDRRGKVARIKKKIVKKPSENQIEACRKQ